MEKYIMTFEDGQHFIADKYTDNDLEWVSNGVLSIIRCSDGMQLTESGEFQELPNWEDVIK